MRRHTRTLLFAGASFLALGGIGQADDAGPAPIVIAQADTGETAAAEQAVLEARAMLKVAKRAGTGVEEAQQALEAALAALETAEAAATPPAPPTEEVIEELEEAAPAPDEAEPSADVAVEEPEPEPPAQAVVEEPSPDPVAEEAPVAEGVAEDAPTEPTVAPEPSVAEEPALEAPADVIAEEPAPAPADIEDEQPANTPQTDMVEEPTLPPADDVAAEPAPQDAAPAADATPPDPTAKPERKPEGTARNPEADGPRKGPPPAVAETPAEEEAAPPLPETAAEIKEGEKVKAAGGRVIEKEEGRVVIRHDDDERFVSDDSKVERRKHQDGRTVTTVERPNGVSIVTVRDADGDIVKRTKRTTDGREIVLIDNDRRGRRDDRPQFDLGTLLPPIILNIPIQNYIVESRRASPQMLFQTLVAPPVEIVERPYSLEEVRYNERVRDKVRRIDIDTVTFDFGQAYVPESQIDALDGIARAVQAAVRRDEREVFLVEGHTDAVGSEIANLALSDRRAESVAEILTYYYDIPPENLITQGYGEAYLKVPTTQAERQNRRVTLRRITPLLVGGG